MGESPSSRAAKIPAAVALLALATVGSWTQRAAFPLLNDDVAYLGSACQMARLDALEWGPAYAALYCGLRRVVTDPFAAFWLKQAAVLLLAGVLVYALGRRCGLGPVMAPLAGLWCVLALLGPNGTLELAFLLGLSACLCAMAESRAGWAGFFVAMGLAFLVRTEYVIGIAGALGLLGWRRDRKRGEAGGALLMGAVILALCLALAWGRVPGQQSRSWFAFGQQYAVSFAERHSVSGDPLVDWERIVAQSFPTSTSILGAARENPRRFAGHVGYNLLIRLPRAVARLLLPVPSFSNSSAAGNAVLGVAALVLGLLAALRGERETRLVGEGRLTALLALAFIPLVSLLFRPQARHVLPMIPLLVVLAGRGLSAPLGRERSAALRVLRVGCAGLLATGAIAPWVTWATTPRATPSLAGRIRELAQVAQQRRVRVLASWYADRICSLVGARCEAAALGEDDAVDAIVLDPQWATRPEVQADPRVRGLLSPQDGLVCVADPPTEGLQFVRCLPR